MNDTKKSNLLTSLLLAQLFILICLVIGVFYRVNQVYSIAALSQQSVEDSGPEFITDIPVETSPSIGSESAPITIVEYSDFTCGYCNSIRSTLTKIIDEYEGQVRLVYKHFPVAGEGSFGFQAAVAAECANRQGSFWAMHELLFENQPNFSTENLKNYAAVLELDEKEFEACLVSDSAVRKVLDDFDEAQSYSVGGTPTFFINGHRVVGAAPYSTFTKEIDQALSQAEIQ